MAKICFLGAGSTVFAKNVLGDCILTPEIGSFDVALYDIDKERLNDSKQMLDSINRKYNGKATIKAYSSRLDALRGSDFVVNAIQVGGYEPCTVTDFEIPKKFGLRQTIADTLGIGGIFRALRTFPVLDGIAQDMYKVCPKAIFLNYTNPMSMLTGYLISHLKINAIGLCHSVQVCAENLLRPLKMDKEFEGCKWKIAGINHQSWLLEITDKFGNDLYPEIKRRSFSGEYDEAMKHDKVRLDIMKKFGFYNTESSEHTAEYSPYYIKRNYPELIEQFNIPLDEYPRRCREHIESWQNMRNELFCSQDIEHIKSSEYASCIIKAVITNQPFRVHGNVMNTAGLIENLPREACVEVPCMIDSNGINPCVAGKLPTQLAALNMSNISTQLMTIEAGITKKKNAIYQAAFLDNHTAAELSLDDIVKMCDELIAAHGDWLPKFN